jgi:hypothetical protein
MKKTLFTLTILLFVTLVLIIGRAVSKQDKPLREKSKFDTRIDNIFYWIEMARKGYTPFNPVVEVKRAIYTGSRIHARSVLTEDAPDIPVTDLTSTQSENSVFIHPGDVTNVLNSNNSTNQPINDPAEDMYGANGLFSFDVGETWEGNIEGAGGRNNGDPTTAIGLNGRWYVNFINNNWGQSIAYSDDMGESWTTRTIAANPGEAADKNHMWIDNSPDSPYEGNLYVAWTDFGGANYGDIVLSRSSNDGDNWSPVINISSATGGFKQGVNLQTGPEGEVYAVWAEYYGGDNVHDEDAIAFARSIDGGETWEPAYTIKSDIRGIRGTGVHAGIRVNSFPVMAVDISEGSRRGNIYIVWANIGVPGTNEDPDMDIYMIRSEDQGETWSSPVRVNQDPAGNGKEHFFPWITCDPKTGSLAVIFYDDRNFGEGTCEVYCANSLDGGDTWEDFKVSDVAFTPSPIPGTASNYFGDYLGISSRDGFVYPVWTDNRTGTAMTYCSPYQYNALAYPDNLEAEVTFETGTTILHWDFPEPDSILYFNIYREGNLIGTSLDTVYTDTLPDYGKYYYQVTAQHGAEQESAADGTWVQWGNAGIHIEPDSLYEELIVDSNSVKYLNVSNTGQLPLFYSISTYKPQEKSPAAYCEAKGSGEEEYIDRVILGDLNNPSGKSEYSDFTGLGTNLELGEEYEMFVSVGTYYLKDQVGAWIDWNHNEVFDEPMIRFDIVEDTTAPDTVVFSGKITVPLGAVTGETRLRIRLTYTGDLLPCGTTIWGEVEDYTVVVQNWLDITPVHDTIQAGKNGKVAILFNAMGIAPGLYRATATFSNNDPASADLEVPLVLQVSETMVDATAMGQELVCQGVEVNLSAVPHGSYDSLAFYWYSNPGGFASTLQNPSFIADSSRMYIVEMTTNERVFSDSVYITVKPQPVVDLGPDTSFCGNYLYSLDAGEAGIRYYWSTGDTSRMIQVDTNTLYQGYGERIFIVAVHGSNFCISKDTVRVTYVNCTGLEEINSTGMIRLYPNPNNGKFTLDLSSLSGKDMDVTIFDPNGRIVYSEMGLPASTSRQKELDLQGLPPGLYLLMVTSEGNSLTESFIIR